MSPHGQDYLLRFNTLVSMGDNVLLLIFCVFLSPYVCTLLTYVICVFLFLNDRALH